MPQRQIARLSWDLPHGEEKVVWMCEEDRIYFGRDTECQIQFGRAPYDDRVPSVWGCLTWDRRVRIENLAERVAKWSFTLHPTFPPNAPRDEGPMVVAPGAECSLSTSQFEIRALAPGGLGLLYTVRVSAFRPKRTLLIQGEPSVNEVRLTSSEKIVGGALVRPLQDGAAVPATYAECAVLAGYSQDGARDAIERIDGKLAEAGLYRDGTTRKTPERVAQMLMRHPHLLA